MGTTDNPYAAHGSAAYPARDVRLFCSVLELYKRFRGRDMPFFELAGMYLKSWFFSAILVGVSIFVIRWVSDGDGVVAFAGCCFMGGMLVGRLGRDIKQCQLTAKLWPVIRDVLSWELVDAKLEELVSENSEGNREP